MNLEHGSIYDTPSINTNKTDLTTAFNIKKNRAYSKVLLLV